MATRLSSAAKTDVGLKRTNNEDNLILVPSQGLYVLADGMGGHASGQVASTMCVSHVAKFICETAKQPGFEFPYKTAPDLSFEAKLLVNAIKFANERVFIQSCKDRSMEGMGTTVTAILNAPQGLILAHVGDSRIYRVRNGQIKQMTRDHSLLNHLLDKGELKPEDAANFANKNVILRAIGLKDYVEVEVQEVKREQGDIYMMCSDGLSDIVSDSLIAQAIANNAKNLPEACNALISLALKAGGKDNVTVVCVGIEQEDDTQSQPAPAVSRMNMAPVQPGMMPPGMMPPNMQQPGMMPPGMMPPNMQQPGMMPPNMQNMGARPMNMQQNLGRMPMNPAAQFANAPNMGMPPMQRQNMPMPIGTGMSQMPQMPAAAKPQRMHSVREIIERRPAPRPMPKPIGTAGRSGSMPSMPAAPGMTKVKPAAIEEWDELNKQNAEDVRQTAQNDQEELHNNERDTAKAVSPQEKLQTSELRNVSTLTNEEKAELPETSLLLMEAPTAADAQEPQVKSSNLVAGFDEDDCRTIIECPIITDDMLSIPDEEDDDDEDKTRVTSRPDMSFSPASNPTDNDDIKTQDLPKVSAPAFRGYVAPKEAITPPKDDFDDDDSIEIGVMPKKPLKSFCFEDDDDDDEATRQFTKPSFGFNNKPW